MIRWEFEANFLKNCLNGGIDELESVQNDKMAYMGERGLFTHLLQKYVYNQMVIIIIIIMVHLLHYQCHVHIDGNQNSLHRQNNFHPHNLDYCNHGDNRPIINKTLHNINTIIIVIIMHLIQLNKQTLVRSYLTSHSWL